MGSPIGLTKEGENGKHGQNGKNPFFKVKSGNKSGNDKALEQVAKIYADTYNKGDHDYW